MNTHEAADLLERFIEGTNGTWEWDDFTLGPRSSDSQVRVLQERMAQLPSEFPPEGRGAYCSEAGISFIRSRIKELRSSAS